MGSTLVAEEEEEEEDAPLYIPKGCIGCVHLIGEFYNKVTFICAMHPFGNDECPDREGEGFNSSLASQWLTENESGLLTAAYAQKVLEFPVSVPPHPLFLFSVHRFLDWGSFCLKWNDYEELRSREFELYHPTEEYKFMFKTIKHLIPEDLDELVFRDLQNCLDTILDRLDSLR